MKTYEILEAGLRHIGREERWTQRSYRTITGQMCAVGAVCEAVRSGWLLVHDKLVPSLEVGCNAGPALRALEEHTGGIGVQIFNDNRTHAEVVELFQKAIRSEKQRAGVLLETPSECSETQRVYGAVAA